MRALAFFAAVRDLAFLSTVVPAFDAARATMGSKFGAVGALTCARFVADREGTDSSLFAGVGAVVLLASMRSRLLEALKESPGWAN
jgi:hypothetical protein